MGIGKDFSIVMGWRGGLVWGEEEREGMMRMRTLTFRLAPPPPTDVGCGGEEKNLSRVEQSVGLFLGIGIGFDGDGNIDAGVRTVIESPISTSSRVSV